MEKVVFLDRDGVINTYPGRGNYVNSLKEFSFIPGSIEAIRKLTEKGFKIFVVSNQAGVAKGLYSQKDLDQMDARMLKAVNKAGGKICGIYYCIHFHDSDCDCRKPKVGMLKKALAESGIKPDQTFLIGDSFVDLAAARNFGAKTILVLSGREKISNRDNWEFEPEYIFDNLLLAAHYLSSHYA